MVDIKGYEGIYAITSCGKVWSYKAKRFLKIEDAPTADVVEVVRCKDCKHNVANWQHDELDIEDYTDIVLITL